MPSFHSHASLLRTLAGAIVTTMAISTGSHAQVPSPSTEVVVLAAGSLRDAMIDLRQAYEKKAAERVALSYGPSGKLREEIEAGRRADVFASASPDHTNALVGKQLLSASAVFARNDLCIVARSGLGLTAQNLLQVITDPAVRLATSTPVSDPMGDYTWELFRKADQGRPGSYAALDAKALKLSGASAPAPGAKLPYVTAFEENRADAYIMYCTNAAITRKALPAVTVVHIPDALNVRSAYGIGAAPSSEGGQRFVRFVLSAEGQDILRSHGFN